MYEAVDYRKEPPPPIDPGWYSTREVASLFGWSSRQMVDHAARQEHWETKRTFIGNRHATNLYAEADVLFYWRAKRRTFLLKKIGLTCVGLLRKPRPGEMDITCPTCGSYGYSTAAGSMCVNGHRPRVAKAGL